VKRFTPHHEKSIFREKLTVVQWENNYPPFYVTKVLAYHCARFSFGPSERAVVAYVLLGNDARSVRGWCQSPSDSAPNLGETGPFIITLPTGRYWKLS
jgi:hypothetical protein